MFSPRPEDIQNLVDEIVKSPAAQRMLQNTVTEGFYNRSRIALWMFEVIGREWDEVREFVRTLPYERFPQTATWSIPIWEFVYEIEPDDSLTLEQRRARILARRLDHPPINPARIENTLSMVTGLPVEVQENVAPYTFEVILDESDTMIFDHRQALRVLREMKPSHLSFRYGSSIYIEFDFELVIAAAISEIYYDYFAPDEPTEQFEMPIYSYTSLDEVTRENFTLEAPTDRIDTPLNLAAALEEITIDYFEAEMPPMDISNTVYMAFAFDEYIVEHIGVDEPPKAIESPIYAAVSISDYIKEEFLWQ